MTTRTGLRAAVATTGLSAVSIASVLTGPPVSAAPSPRPVTREVALTAAAVPPGGLLASLLINQVHYCAIICPLVVDTAVTAGVTTVRVPATFLTALRSGDLLQAVGAAAASVTGPTNEAAQAAILADGSRVAPRAFNALEVAVVGLLDILPATASGVPGIIDALRTAREDTFTALNAPIVANPVPTAHPDGVLQVVVVESLNVVGAVIFPAFNHVLSAVFDAPDAFARELAVSGNLGLAAAAGVRTAAGHVHAAVSVVGQTVHTGLQHVATAIEESRPHRRATERDVDASTPQRRDRHTETAGVRHVRGARASRTERADATSAGKRLAERTDRGRGAGVERRR
ncbi:hypothetical protein ASG82_25920 [Mycobacterium sp. Soil538]|nr:hypothetical protein ASG82_25920 [Mycobacterium sp. Soil538]